MTPITSEDISTIAGYIGSLYSDLKPLFLVLFGLLFGLWIAITVVTTIAQRKEDKEDKE